MSEIERIQKYIDRTKFPKKKEDGYCLCFGEMDAFKEAMDRSAYGALLLLFEYGRAKGYRAAKAEVRA